MARPTASAQGNGEGDMPLHMMDVDPEIDHLLQEFLRDDDFLATSLLSCEPSAQSAATGAPEQLLQGNGSSEAPDGRNHATAGTVVTSPVEAEQLAWLDAFPSSSASCTLVLDWLAAISSPESLSSNMLSPLSVPAPMSPTKSPLSSGSDADACFQNAEEPLQAGAQRPGKRKSKSSKRAELPDRDASLALPASPVSSSSNGSAITAHSVTPSVPTMTGIALAQQPLPFYDRPYSAAAAAHLAAAQQQLHGCAAPLFANPYLPSFASSVYPSAYASMGLGPQLWSSQASPSYPLPATGFPGHPPMKAPIGVHVPKCANDAPLSKTARETQELLQGRTKRRRRVSHEGSASDVSEPHHSPEPSTASSQSHTSALAEECADDAANPVPLSAEVKKQLRMHKNRVAASESRKRARAHVESLESKAEALVEENKRLNAALRTAVTENAQLRDQVGRLAAAVDMYQAGVAPLLAAPVAGQGGRDGAAAAAPATIKAFGAMFALALIGTAWLLPALSFSSAPAPPMLSGGGLIAAPPSTVWFPQGTIGAHARHNVIGSRFRGVRRMLALDAGPSSSPAASVSPQSATRRSHHTPEAVGPCVSSATLEGPPAAVATVAPGTSRTSNAAWAKPCGNHYYAARARTMSVPASPSFDASESTSSGDLPQMPHGAGHVRLLCVQPEGSATNLGVNGYVAPLPGILPS